MTRMNFISLVIFSNLPVIDVKDSTLFWEIWCKYIQLTSIKQDETCVLDSIANYHPKTIYNTRYLTAIS